LPQNTQHYKIIGSTL